jgi:hypothetical protein
VSLLYILIFVILCNNSVIKWFSICCISIPLLPNALCNLKIFLTASEGALFSTFSIFVLKSLKSETWNPDVEDALKQWFPTCGTQTGAKWYVDRFQNKNLTIFCLLKKNTEKLTNFNINRRNIWSNCRFRVINGSKITFEMGP